MPDQHGNACATAAFSDMLIKLPGRAPERKRALDWLVAHRVGHLVLFQEVKIHDLQDGERFRTWLAERRDAHEGESR